MRSVMSTPTCYRNDYNLEVLKYIKFITINYSIMELKYATISFCSSQFLIVFITWGMYKNIGLDSI